MILVPAVGALIALLVYATPYLIRLVQRTSDTRMNVAGTDQKPIEGLPTVVYSLLIEVLNKGYDNSVVHREFALAFREPKHGSLMTFGDLRLTAQDRLRTIGPRKSQFLQLDITSIKPSCSVDGDEFWKKCGEIEVVLRGKVTESDGEVRNLEDAVPLKEIRNLIIDKKDPNSPKGTCPCAR